MDRISWLWTQPLLTHLSGHGTGEDCEVTDSQVDNEDIDSTADVMLPATREYHNDDDVT